MASPQAPRATYFGQGNRGFATTLKYTEEDPYLKTLIDLEKDKIATQKKREEEVFGAIKDLDKPYYAYEERVSGKVTKFLDDYAAGKYTSQLDALRGIQEIKSEINTSKGVETAFNTGIKPYQNDKEVNYGAYQPLAVLDLEKKVNAGQDPTDIDFEEVVTPENALDVYNVPKIFANEAVGLGVSITSFDTTKNYDKAPPGFVGILSENVSSNIPNFLEVTYDSQGNASYKFKDPSNLPKDYYRYIVNNNKRLRKTAIGNIYRKDPSKVGATLTEDEIVESTKDLLMTYGTGKTEVKISRDVQTKAIPRSEAPSEDKKQEQKEPTEEQKRTLWYNDITKGDQNAVQNAIDYLVVAENRSVQLEYPLLESVAQKITSKNESTNQDETVIKVIPQKTSNKSIKTPNGALSPFYISSDDFRNNRFTVVDIKKENFNEAHIYLRVGSRIRGSSKNPVAGDNIKSGDIVKIVLNKDASPEALSNLYEIIRQQKGVGYGKGEGTGELTTPTTTTTTTPTPTPPKTQTLVIPTK